MWKLSLQARNLTLQMWNLTLHMILGSSVSKDSTRYKSWHYKQRIWHSVSKSLSVYLYLSLSSNIEHGLTSVESGNTDIVLDCHWTSVIDAMLCK